MRDSLLPSSGGGGSKLVIVLLVATAGVLIAAGVVIFTRKTASSDGLDKPAAALIKKIDVPQPLVESQADRPIVEDKADVVDAGAQAPKENARRAPRGEPMGTIEPATVDQFMKSRFAEVRICYERRLKNNPLLEGKLDVNITVSSAGKVTSVARNSDTVRDEDLWTCVKKAIRGWQFPKPKGGQVIVAKTFDFKKK